VTYAAAYQHPNFAQALPVGPAWEYVGCECGCLLYRDLSSGAQALVPAIWYNLPPADYAKTLRFNAERSDECAAHRRKEAKPWATHEAATFERQARRLRAMALLCDRSPAPCAGQVEFLGLNDPSQSREAEAMAIEHAEAQCERF